MSKRNKPKKGEYSGKSRQVSPNKLPKQYQVKFNRPTTTSTNNFIITRTRWLMEGELVVFSIDGNTTTITVKGGLQHNASIRSLISHEYKDRKWQQPPKNKFPIQNIGDYAYFTFKTSKEVEMRNLSNEEGQWIAAGTKVSVRFSFITKPDKCQLALECVLVHSS